MKTATIRQVRNDFGTVLSWVESGEEVTVLKRRTVVARICPPRASGRDNARMPDFAARARAIFGRKKTHLTDAVLQEREASRW